MRELKEDFYIGKEHWCFREKVNERYIYQVTNQIKNYCFFIGFRLKVVDNKQVRPAVSYRACFEETTFWWFKSNSIGEVESWCATGEKPQPVEEKNPKVFEVIKSKSVGRPRVKRKVLQIDKSGNIVKIWENINEVTKLGWQPCNIIGACKGRLKSAYKFKWKFEDEYEINK